MDFYLILTFLATGLTALVFYLAYPEIKATRTPKRQIKVGIIGLLASLAISCALLFLLFVVTGRTTNLAPILFPPVLIFICAWIYFGNIILRALIGR